jgi:hypothetical protein
LPEVVGDGGLLVDPYDTGAIAAAIQRIDRDDDLSITFHHVNMYRRMLPRRQVDPELKCSVTENRRHEEGNPTLRLLQGGSREWKEAEGFVPAVGEPEGRSSGADLQAAQLAVFARYGQHLCPGRQKTHLCRPQSRGRDGRPDMAERSG